jgi:Tfp pilus assembly protein PilF
MDSLMLVLRLYFRPGSAMSGIMDRGSWMFAAVAVLVISIAFFGTINNKLESTYRIPDLSQFYEPGVYDDDPAAAKASFDSAKLAYEQAMAGRSTIPLVGDKFFRFFSFESKKFYQPLLLLSIFYVPALMLLMSIFGRIGSFGLVLRRDYGTLAVCTLNAWAAAHLPFAVAGLLLYTQSADPHIYLGLWAASSLVFGVLMVFALRTVFGANFGIAVINVCIATLSFSLGTYVFSLVSPLLFSPFLIFYAFIYLGGSLGGEVRGFGNALRQKQNLKRFLHNATVNPKDADAHVQLGIIYLQRRQNAKAIEHLSRAVEIDKNEIDANFELGKLARSNGDLQGALNHFSIVVEQNDKHALSEVWREIGATYFAANMLDDAREALDKFVERRSADVEGLYYLGKVLKAQGEHDRASATFAEAVDSARTAPDYHKNRTRHWSKLAQREI